MSNPENINKWKTEVEYHFVFGWAAPGDHRTGFLENCIKLLAQDRSPSPSVPRYPPPAGH